MSQENINQLEEKIKKLEKTILQKDMPEEDREKLLIEMENLKRILKQRRAIK